MADHATNQPPQDVNAASRDAVLEILENPTCRRVLSTLNGRSLTAKEISHRADIPLSTVYRVVSDLGKTGFVTESIRFNPDGRHVTEFTRTVAAVTVTFDDEIAIDVAARDGHAE